MQKQALSQLAVYVAIVETNYNNASLRDCCVSMFNNSEELVTKLLLLHLTFMNHVTVQRIVFPGSKEETRHPLSYQIHMK